MNPRVSAAAATALYRYPPARPCETASANVPPLYDERECEGYIDGTRFAYAAWARRCDVARQTRGARSHVDFVAGEERRLIAVIPDAAITAPVVDEFGFGS